MSYEKKNILLGNLLTVLPYAQRFFPLMRPEYFGGQYDPQHIFFKALKTYFLKYGSLPTKELLIIEVDSIHGVEQETIDKTTELANSIDEVLGSVVHHPPQWLEDQTQAFLNKQHFHTCLIDQMKIVDDDEHYLRPVSETLAALDPILERLKKPPSTQTNKDLQGSIADGPAFLDQLRAYANEQEPVIPFGVSCLNRAVRGVHKKHLNMIIAATSVGKSLFLCNSAADYLRQGLNVTYFTMEMDEAAVNSRIFANVLDIPLDANSKLTVGPDVEWPDNLGTLVVRVFPNGGAGVNEFSSYIAELKAKRNIITDVVFVDYLGICKSSRSNATAQQYQVMGNVAAELQALAQTTDTAIWTACQANRQGMAEGTELNLTHISDSAQITHHADLVLTMWKAKEGEKQYNLLHWKVEKIRNGAGAGAVGSMTVNRSKMRLYDVSVAEDIKVDAVREKLKDNATFRKNKLAPVFDIDKVIHAG